LSLPSEYAIVKKLSLDSDEKDVGEAIGWELSQHIIGRSKNIRLITKDWASPPTAPSNNILPWLTEVRLYRNLWRF